MTSSIIVEIRPRLQVCNVFMMTKECLTHHEAVKISIKQTLIDIEWTSNPDKFQQINLRACKLVPNSLSALQIQQNSISFRLQTEPLSNITGSFSAEILEYKETASDTTKFVPPIVVNELCEVKCRCCENVLSTIGTAFSRVLPLPSATWESGDWFCHNHSHSSDTEPEPVVIKPKGTDCLYGSCFILVPASSLNVGNNVIVRCKRCLSWLGTSHKSKVKLWNCNVVCGSSYTPTSRTALEDFIYVVKEAIHGSVGMLCRLIVETRLADNEIQYLLLWVMDDNLQLLVDIGSELDALECQLKSRQCIKLLYMHHTDCTLLVKSWQDDVNVQCIDVAKQMFNEGLQYLVNVTQFIPPINRTTNNFYVSYLGILD